MKTINTRQEFNFICSEKRLVPQKGDLAAQLLSISEVLLINFINAKKVKMKKFFRVIYLKVEIVLFQLQKSSYWFYITGKDGVTHYAETLEEHNQNISKFL